MLPRQRTRAQQPPPLATAPTRTTPVFRAARSSLLTDSGITQCTRVRKQAHQNALLQISSSGGCNDYKGQCSHVRCGFKQVGLALERTTSIRWQSVDKAVVPPISHARTRRRSTSNHVAQRQNNEHNREGKQRPHEPAQAVPLGVAEERRWLDAKMEWMYRSALL